MDGIKFGIIFVALYLSESNYNKQNITLIAFHMKFTKACFIFILNGHLFKILHICTNTYIIHFPGLWKHMAGTEIRLLLNSLHCFYSIDLHLLKVFPSS